MGIGSGLGSSIGVVAESTYGTYVAPTRWYEFSGETLEKKKNAIQGGGLAAGRMQQLGSRRVINTLGGGGNVMMEVTTTKMGLLLQHLMGTTVTPVQQAATAAYKQTHTLADNFGKSLTIQKGVPDVGGTARPYSFLGCKVASAEFTCSLDDFLKVNLEIDAQDVTEGQTLAAPSYVSNSPFSFLQMSVKLGTYGAETAVTGIRGVNVKIERPMNVDRQYAGAAGLKAEPIMNDFVKITGSIDADYVTKADLADRFASDSSTSLVVEWVGANIESTYYYTFRINVPMIFVDGTTPQVEGPDVVSTSYAFVSQYDGTNLPSIVYTSTDTTV